MTSRLALLLGLFAIGCSSATAPQVPLDPPAAVHVLNRTGAVINAWTIIVGTDLSHSGVAFQGEVAGDDSTHRASCLFSGSTAGERRFIEAAVQPVSNLDSFLVRLTAGGPFRDAWADSISKGQINLAAFLAAHPGLVAATSLFDPAPSTWPPAGWPTPAPFDTVPWRWVVTGPGANTIAVDTTDHGCY